MNDYKIDINGHCLEYFDDDHLYMVDGIIVPSITQMLGIRFHGKYSGIPEDVLNKASELGTKVHNAIYEWCVNGTESDLPEVRGFKFLQKIYQFSVVGNEVPVILFVDDEPVAAGRLDLVLQNEIGELGLADIKRTSVLDKDYLFHQLNLYRLAFEESYGNKIEFLKGVHLKMDTRKYVDIPISEAPALELVQEYMEANK